MNARRLTISLLAALAAIFAAAVLTGCEGLAVSYTREWGGQSLTGFVAGDSYGVVGKRVSGKQPVKVNPQK